MADKVTGDRGVPETNVEVNADAAFDEAFVEATKVGEPADVSAADNPDNVKAEAPLTEAKPPVPEPDVATPEPDASLQQPGETDEKYEQRYKTLQGIHRHDKESWDTERTKLLSDLEEAKKPKTPVITEEKKIAAEAFVDSLTDEQKKQLEEYEQDFDVVSKMEGMKRSAELAKLRKEMQEWKDEVTSQLTAQQAKVAPALELAETAERDSHFNMIRQGYRLEDGTVVEGHGDFETYRDDGSLLKWIDAKPKYLQSAMKKTYSQGTPQDVIDLYTDFKRDSNIPLNNQPSDNVIPINSRKAERKQALTSVTTRRGAVNIASSVRDDFDGAFEEASSR